MRTSWDQFFDRVAKLEAALIAQGTPREQAHRIALDVTAQPTSRRRAARLIAAVVRRRLRSRLCRAVLVARITDENRWRDILRRT
jgi:hypothetical protein